MNIALGIILLILALVIHEAGHAIAMMRRGVTIKEAGLGLPMGKIKLTLRPSFLPFPVVITPLLLGAYVEPTEAGQEKLTQFSYKDQAVCYAAGVVMNLVFGGVIIMLLWLAPVISDGASWIPAASMAAITVIIILARRLISMLTPLLGIAVLILVVVWLIDSTENIGGPVTVATFVASGNNIREAVVIGALMSINLAFFNTLPLVPLDGGRVVNAFLETRGWMKVSTVFTFTTVAIFLGFFGFVIINDFI